MRTKRSCVGLIIISIYDGIFTCAALAKAGLVVGPLPPAVRNTLGVLNLCNLYTLKRLIHFLSNSA